ncbi:MAG: tRNA threonylcarbamoyladenosine dehydratase [Desulfobacterales bacterium]|nr:tRNA threonylcarbamoyladenosine dehydratase [Desulfobacterales bacterium]
MNTAESPFIRSIMLYGEEGFFRLQHSFVTIIGMGGVGAYAAEALVRSGLGKIRIVDCDIIKTSDINRQLLALSTTLGLPKVVAAKERLHAINPHLIIDCCHSFFHSDTKDDLITADVHMVIDAIDSLNPKIELIKHCIDQNIPFISVMGAAGRIDPFQIHVSMLSETMNCSLARAVRRRLNKHGISAKVPVIFSEEIPCKCHADLAHQMTTEATETSGTYLRGRFRQAIPSIATLPAIFGLIAANYVITHLLQKS